MSRSLPRKLLYLLGFLSLASFGGGVYVENRHLDFLQDHPILVNLLSGIIGFPVGILVVAIGFNWFIVRDEIAKLAYLWGEEWLDVTRHARRHASCLYWHLEDVGMAKRYMSFENPLAIVSRIARPMDADHDFIHCATLFCSATMKLLPVAENLISKCSDEGRGVVAPGVARKQMMELRDALGKISEHEGSSLEVTYCALDRFERMYSTLFLLLRDSAKRHVLVTSKT